MAEESDFRGLLVGVLSATAVVALMRNQSPQPTSEQPTAQSTPTVAESPKPALEADNAPSTSVSTESPAVDEASQSENQLQQNTEPTSSPVDSASQPENQPQNIADGEESTQPEDEREEEAESKPGNQSQATDSLQSRNHSEQPKGSTGSADRNSLPGFPIGTDEGTVKSALGEPTKTSRGVWRNTRAAIYDIKPNRITLGYLFDRKSGQLRQTEVSFAQSVEPEVMQATLQRMLGSNASGEIEQGLQQVYQRRTNKYSFNVGELKGTIERNYRDRIYIGVWDADLH